MEYFLRVTNIGGTGWYKYVHFLVGVVAVYTQTCTRNNMGNGVSMNHNSHLNSTHCHKLQRFQPCGALSYFQQMWDTQVCFI